MKHRKPKMTRLKAASLLVVSGIFFGVCLLTYFVVSDSTPSKNLPEPVPSRDTTLPSGLPLVEDSSTPKPKVSTPLSTPMWVWSPESRKSEPPVIETPSRIPSPEPIQDTPEPTPPPTVSEDPSSPSESSPETSDSSPPPTSSEPDTEPSTFLSESPSETSGVSHSPSLPPIVDKWRCWLVDWCRWYLVNSGLHQS